MLDEAEQIVRATLDSLSYHIVVVDALGEIVLANEAWRKFAEANGIRWQEVSEGANYLAVCEAARQAGVEEAVTFAEGLLSVLDGGLREYVMEYPCHSPTENRWFIARVTRFFTAADKRHLVIVHEDITKRKLAEEATSQQALHDSLTGLPNRRLLLDRFAQALSRVAREGDSLAVLYLDLDNFKEINDTFGHEAGDHVLVEVARRLSNCLRETDTVARFGGDEFVVLLEQASGEKAAAIATRITQALTEPFCVRETHTILTSSIGIALSNFPHKRPEDLLRFADHAMYKSKQKGEGRYTLFEPAT